MNEEIINQLRQITPEERRILEGESNIDRQLYMLPEDNIIDANKLLEQGKLIQVRKHTRFVHFPSHKHNYIEVIYMCAGKTHHLIDGRDVILETGELLFLSQNAVQEIYPAAEQDIAVNFIILPAFFDYGLQLIGSEDNLLRAFIVDCLKGENSSAGYLHFRVSEILPIQNLVENLIWTIQNKQPNKRGTNQVTMGLLFLQLMNYMDKMETKEAVGGSKMVIPVLKYVEEHYKDGTLAELASQLHYDKYWLSKEIKKKIGANYTELIQTKRLTQAAYLLEKTKLSVLEVALAVGYENISYFHRIFQKKYQQTPRAYRLLQKDIANGK